MPYKANTRYNWDPIYQKKIKIDKNTWRGDPFYEIRPVSYTHLDVYKRQVGGSAERSMNEP